MSSPTLRPATTYPAIVGTVIAQVRRRKGMSQKGLADAVGVNQSTWSRIETGQSSLSVEQLTKAARALGRSPGEILDLAEYTRVDLKKRGIHVEEERPEAPVDNVWVLIGVAALALIVIAVLASASKRKR